MVTFLTVIHILVCLFLILVVLLQAGKGGGMGIAFGGAGSQTVFGSSGAGNFLTRLTSITATVFLLTSLALAHYSSQQDSKRLQQLASERATEKKSEDEKAAKLKAELEKTRAATAAVGGAPGAGTAGTTETLVVPKIEVTPTSPGAPADKTTTPEAKAPGKVVPPTNAAPAETQKPAGALTVPKPVAPKPVVVRKPKPVVAAPATEGEAPATPVVPAAPAAPPAAPAE